MSNFTDQQQSRLKDILSEKSLWKVYLTSRRIQFSRINTGGGVLVAIAVTAFAIQADSPSALADQLLSFSTTAFGLSIGQLGFLLAGFSFFATVADKEMFCRMAEKTHEPSGLSWLKYNFYIFMRVFVEYLVFSLACLVLMVMLAKGVGIRESIADYLNQWPKIKHYIAASAFGVFIGCFFYLVLQLSSFIYNIFHVVMTSIRWALEQDYKKQNAETQQSEVIDQDVPDEINPDETKQLTE